MPVASSAGGASEIADFMLGVVNADGRQHLSDDMAVAIVGGINELVLQAIEQDQVGLLHDLVAPSSQLVRAGIGSQSGQNGCLSTQEDHAQQSR